MEEDAIAARLAAVKAKRGYLLPHHGLLAVLSEPLLEAYDAAYTRLALDPKVLGAREREFVWLAVLIATDEAAATHHIPKFLDGGGTREEVAAALRLSAWAVGAGAAYRFVAEWWTPHLPGLDVWARYRADLARVAPPVALRLAVPAAAAVHAARRDHAALAEAIRFAYAEGVPEPELAEALSIMMFPGSVPHFVEAARVWLRLIRDGEVAPSPAFAAWARLGGQGGWDEAVGAARGV
ncbi:MAG: carboxymuconolactone decarboxylase family protein [Acetobacteraceae bacterium]|nr:carboxymuconolactone decarboxylase family protein [Acetobacteraceae bacterium]MCX7684257.1 carboxymuconolactone decarboxylase family protein [Acetobacteraceae bacterium]MDW8398531.1 carboxymuconolactone decarboxylase family protein [Acetobacteraceae bacterium]